MKYTRLFLIASALGASIAASAMPARPGAFIATMPDGSKVQLTLHGDEYFHYATTPEGFTLLPDGKGFWAFAREHNGAIKPGDIRYTGAESSRAAAARGYAKHLAPKPSSADRAKAAARDLQIDGTFPPKGNRKLLMLLINYADAHTTYSQADFNAYMNRPGYRGTGSFRDYYLENSYGMLDIATTVTRWVTLSQSKNYYGANGAPEMIAEALAILDSEIDLNDFDNDGDGILDGLAVIHQGTGAESSGNTNEIWSHSSSIYGLQFDGVQVRRYTIQPEIFDNHISTIGVMCHEFGHNLGAPDFYDTDYELSGGTYPGTGAWDLMGSGAWNGDYGTAPAGTNAWQKTQLGWVDPVMLTANTHIDAMPPASSAPAAYRFNTTMPGEYYILENRQQEGRFDSYLPHHGLIAYHVNEKAIADRLYANTLNCGYPQAIYTVCAGANEDPADNSASYGWVNTAQAPFPGSEGRTSFSDTTLPSAKSITGRHSYCGLSNITENADGTIAFDFNTYPTPARPEAFVARSNRDVVELTWQAPLGEEAPVKYNIYRNSEHIATTQATEYTDAEAGDLETITYDVDAEYASGLVSPCVTAEVRRPKNIIDAISVGNLQDGCSLNDVLLEWSLNKHLTRMEGNEADYVVHDVAAKKVETAHRFRVEDLAVYSGYKIDAIGFVPAQSQRTVTTTISVYLADPATGELSLYNSRKVSETGIAQWNEARLPSTKPLTISPGQEIWVAVCYESNNGTVQLVTDKGPVIDGMGAYCKVDDGEWKADDSYGGNFLIYAKLTGITTPEGDSEFEIDTAPAEVDMIDLCFPQGFAVYRDSKLIGTTNGRKLSDIDVPEGNYTYAITCLYKGGNESVAKTVNVNVQNSGITPVEAPAAPEAYYDILGRKVDASAKGVLIRKQGSTATKVIR